MAVSYLFIADKITRFVNFYKVPAYTNKNGLVAKTGNQTVSNKYPINKYLFFS
jgi:hypothetical protein